MSIAISCDELHDARKSRGYIEERKIVREHTRKFRIVTDDPTMDSYSVGASATSLFGLPVQFAVHPGDTSARCGSVDIDAEDVGAFNWIATVQYSTQTIPTEKANENPLDIPVKRSWGVNKIKRPVTKDIHGHPILNTAGCPYETPYEQDFYNPILTFVRNEATFDGSLPRTYMGRVNDGVYSGGAAGTVRCNDISAEEHFQNDSSYWAVKYEFEYDPLGWNPQLLQQGLMGLAGGTPTLDGGGNVTGYTGAKLARCKDKDGQDVTEPVPLNAFGRKFADGVSIGSLVYVTHETHYTATFTDLGLPA